VAPPEVPPSFDRLNWQYRCATCGVRIVVATVDVARHIETDWPRCCGSVMDLTPLGEPPPDGE
jgi:hypothetical protein